MLRRMQTTKKRGIEHGLAVIARITRRKRPRRPRDRRPCSRLSSSTSSAPYPKPKASPHDSVRSGGFRVSRTSHRVNAVFSSVERPSFVLVVPRGLARNDHLRVRGNDRAFPRQRTVIHPL